MLLREVSELTGRPYPISLILKVVSMSSSGWYGKPGIRSVHRNGAEIIAFNVSKIGNRVAAMEPIRTAVKSRFGTVEKEICDGIGLLLRMDHGSQYDSNDFRKEMDFLGVEMSHAFVRSPECNGCVERFNRTIEEEVFSISTFMTLEEAEMAIAKFIDDYNRG